MMKVVCTMKGKNSLKDKAFKSVSGWFDVSHCDYSFEGDFIDRLVSSIDKSPRIIDNVFNSPVFGTIGPDRLASGTKALIMIYNDEPRNVYSSVCFGDNLAKFIAELSFNHDFTILLDHLFYFANDCRNDKVCVEVEDDITINTCGELFEYCISKMEDPI